MGMYNFGCSNPDCTSCYWSNPPKTWVMREKEREEAKRRKKEKKKNKKNKKKG